MQYRRRRRRTERVNLGGGPALHHPIGGIRRLQIGSQDTGREQRHPRFVVPIGRCCLGRLARRLVGEHGKTPLFPIFTEDAFSEEVGCGSWLSGRPAPNAPHSPEQQ